MQECLALDLLTIGLLSTFFSSCSASTTATDVKYQFINKEGKTALAGRFDRARAFHEGRAVVFVTGQNEFLIDRSGKRISDSYKRIGDMVEGMAKFENKNGDVGFLGLDGKQAIAPLFKFAFPFSNGLARVTDASRKELFIDKTGRVVLIPKFKTTDFKEDRAWAATEDGKIGYVNKEGIFVIAPIFQEGKSFCDGIAIVKQYGKYGWIDRSGRVVIQAKFDECRNFSEGLAAVRVQDKWGFININGELKIPCTLDKEPLSFHNGRARINENGKVAFIDRKGSKVILSSNFSSAGSFSEGLAKATKTVPFHEGVEERTGFIDVRGRWVIPPIFQYVDDFSEGLASVKLPRTPDPSEISRLEPMPEKTKWLFNTFEDYRDLVRMSFVSSDSMIILANGKSYQTKYVMQPISLSDPGLRRFGPSFVPHAKLKITYLGKTSAWAVSFGPGKHFDAFKMYWPASGSDPWGFMLNTGP